MAIPSLLRPISPSAFNSASLSTPISWVQQLLRQPYLVSMSTMCSSRGTGYSLAVLYQVATYRRLQILGKIGALIFNAHFYLISLTGLMVLTNLVRRWPVLLVLHNDRQCNPAAGQQTKFDRQSGFSILDTVLSNNSIHAGGRLACPSTLCFSVLLCHQTLSTFWRALNSDSQGSAYGKRDNNCSKTNDTANIIFL